MRAVGFSIRGIARELGVSRMKVQRVLTASPSVPAAAPDPILALLTDDDMKYLGVTAADVAAGLSRLGRYRMLGLPQRSAAEDAARALSDHGRADGFGPWLEAGW